MVDFSNLKINERLDEEWPNLWVTKIENRNWDNLYINGQIWKLAKLRVLRDIKRMDISKIAEFWFYKLKKI